MITLKGQQLYNESTKNLITSKKGYAPVWQIVKINNQVKELWSLLSI